MTLNIQHITSVHINASIQGRKSQLSTVHVKQDLDKIAQYQPLSSELSSCIESSRVLSVVYTGIVFTSGALAVSEAVTSSLHRVSKSVDHFVVEFLFG